ncbi:MAG: hypothetical protein M9939_22870 [Mesorhizobium sp.]|nr:hypothetical protein [Mesorhizobium sp.]MCO5163961.1 hypothetical protein [Mesorhizobium sp.]
MDEFLVESQWLQERLGDPGVVAIGCSWYNPEAGKSAREKFADEHVLGARFFDLDEASDKDSPYVNMLPSPERFAAVAGVLGIGRHRRSSPPWCRTMCTRGVSPVTSGRQNGRIIRDAEMD